MIPQENSALTVLHIDSKVKQSDRNKTIEHYNYDNEIHEQEALNIVAELRAQIDSKESEVARLREALQRDDEISFPETVDKLKKLQSAFDQVQKMCAHKIDPVELEYNNACASLEGKNWKMERYEKESKERYNACDRINQAINIVIAKMNDPNPNEVNESTLFPLYGQSSSCNFDLDRGKKTNAFAAAKEQKYKGLNESLKRHFTDAVDRENKAERKHKMAQKDLEARCKSKKPSPITKEYLLASKDYEKKKMLLEQEKELLKMLKDNAKKLTNSNRNKVEKLHNLTEEFYELDKYLPNENSSEMLAKEGSLRANLAIAEIERDGLQIELFVAKTKLKAHQQMLNDIQKKTVEIQNILSKHQQASQLKKKEREEIEETLLNTNEYQSELISEQEFLEAQRELLKKRIGEHDDKLKKIKKKTEALKLTLERQMLIKQFNMQKDNLKNCNLEHVANTVEQMLKINDGIGNEVPIPSTFSSSSAHHSEHPSVLSNDENNA